MSIKLHDSSFICSLSIVAYTFISTFTLKCFEFWFNLALLFKLSSTDLAHKPYKHQNLHQQNLYWPIQASSVEYSLPFVDSHFDEVPVLSSHDDENEERSYNPYLIEYHEESNTFTYNDPWDHQTNDISCNDNEISLVVENHIAPLEIPSAHASVESEPTITSITSSENTFHEHSAEVQSTPVEAVEHVPEVSFPHNNHNNNSTTIDRHETFSKLNFPNNFFMLENE